VSEKTVSFKMPEDEVDELDDEANDEGKTRSSYIRSVLRARHIEEQLEDQVLTKEDKREYERTIEELQRQRDELENEMRIARSKVEAMEEAVDETVREAVGPIRGEYETQIHELKEENKRLREEENDELRKQNQELADALEETFELIPSAEHVNEMESNLTELIEEKADRQWQGTTEQRELIMEFRDELLRETKHNRSLLTKVADWIRQRF